MKAAVLSKIGEPFMVTEVTMDQPRGNEVVIDVKGSGLCYSDLYMADVDYGQPIPCVPGHEVAGIVAEIGPQVRDLKVGDHVVVFPVWNCGRCVECATGHATACIAFGKKPGPRDGLPPRLSLDGQDVAPGTHPSGFAERTIMPEDMLVRIPKDVPFEYAAILGCGVVTGAGAVTNSARVGFGESVAVIGCGGVGLSAIQAASLSGAGRIIAIDTDESKLELARALGASDTVNPLTTGSVDAVKEFTAGRGVKHAFEAAGHLSTLEDAIAMLSHGGTAYTVGLQKPGTRLDLSVDSKDPAGLLQAEKGIRGVKMGSTNAQADIPRIAELYLQGKFRLDLLVSELVTLDGVYAALKDRSAGAARKVLTF